MKRNLKGIKRELERIERELIETFNTFHNCEVHSLTKPILHELLEYVPHLVYERDELKRCLNELKTLSFERWSPGAKWGEIPFFINN